VNIKQNIIKLTKTIIDQNYSQFLDTTYIRSEDLAMGAPTSSILSEVYLQYLENSKIFNLLLNHNVIGYFRYVDDILVVYNEDITNIDILRQFNNLTPKLRFTIEKRNRQKDKLLGHNNHQRSREIYNRHPQKANIYRYYHI
jgi:hypothetical protein